MQVYTRFPIVGEVWRAAPHPLHSMNFFVEKFTSKQIAPIYHLRMKLPNRKVNLPIHCKIKAPSKKWFQEKNRKIKNWHVFHW